MIDSEECTQDGRDSRSFMSTAVRDADQDGFETPGQSADDRTLTSVNL